MLDQVEVYNRALTADEVTALYNQTINKLKNTKSLDNLVSSTPAQTLQSKVTFSNAKTKMTDLRATIGKAES
jgi:hypothetical protein